MIRSRNISSGIGAQILAGTQAHGDFAFRRLALANNQHVGDFLQLGVADFLLHALGRGVDVHAQARRSVYHGRLEQGVAHLLGVVATLSLIGMTRAWMGASQVGKAPA